MRIAFFVKVFPARHETFIANQLRGLLARGIQIDVIAQRRGAVNTQSSSLAIHNVLYRSGSTGDRLRGYWNLVRSYLPGKNIERPLSRDAVPFQKPQKYELVHCQYATLGALAIQLREAGVFDAPIVTSVRGFDLTQIDSRGRRLLRRSNLCLPVCKAFHDRLIGYGVSPQHILVHRSGIDLTKFTYSSETPPHPETVHVLSTARLVDKKGIEFAIRAVAKILDNGLSQFPFVYTIIGDGPLRSELEMLSRALGIDQQVQFLGWLPHDQVIERTHHAQLVVNPSVTTSDGTQEGIPNALKEAMACGVPVVATRHSGIPELIEDGVSGYLVPERDVDELALVMARLINNPSLRHQLRDAGRRQVEEKFDIDQLTDELLGCYRSVIHEYFRDGSPSLREK